MLALSFAIEDIVLAALLFPLSFATLAEQVYRVVDAIDVTISPIRSLAMDYSSMCVQDGVHARVANLTEILRDWNVSAGPQPQRDRFGEATSIAAFKLSRRATTS